MKCITFLKMCIKDWSRVTKHKSPLDAPDLMNPALMGGQSDIVKTTNAEMFSLDGDVGATRLGTLVGCGWRVSE